MGVVVVKGPEERDRWNDVNAEKKSRHKRKKRVSAISVVGILSAGIN